MTKLSVNINKIALIRNSRGRNFPSVKHFAERCINLGAHGITLHPRPDQRHARYSDVKTLKLLCDNHGVELNIEGYPCKEFLGVVIDAKPTQCTLVPDSPSQITSDHGWEIEENYALLKNSIHSLKKHGVRTSVFVDHGCRELSLLKDLGCDRVELYTERYAESFKDEIKGKAILESFRTTAISAQNLGLKVNAGHDLSLENLSRFLSIPGIEEVSIGHALIVECIEKGMEQVLEDYIDILEKHA